jgi:hypothetical protein
MALRERVKDVLDEARMVVLVVQVLLGFHFRVILERRFESLPHVVQLVHLAGLGLLVVAFAVAISPAPFHRIAEDGNDTPRVVRFASRMVSLALLPFALALGASLFVVAGVMGTAIEAIVAGAALVVSAVGSWFVWPMMQRQTNLRPDEPSAPTEISGKIEHALAEARMVLPGAQALLGFQFLWFFAEGFAELPRLSRAIHLGSLISVAAAGIILIAPAAFHRIAEDGERTPRFYRYASNMIQASLIPLAMGITGDFYVVVRKVTGSHVDGAFASFAFLLGMLGLWWGLPWLARRA